MIVLSTRTQSGYLQLNLHKDPLATRLGFNHKFIMMVGLYAK